MAPLPRRYTNEDWAIEDVLEEPGRLKRWISTLYPVFKPHAFRSTKKRPNDVEIGRISGIRNGLQREAGQLPPAGIKGKLLFASLRPELGIGWCYGGKSQSG